MSERLKWATVGFILMFIYGIVIFALGPFSGPYTNPPNDKILTPVSIFLLGLGSAVVGMIFSLLLRWFYRRERVIAVYAGAIMVALVLILSLIDGPVQGDTDVARIFLTYYLPGSLISIPFQPFIPTPAIFYFIVVTFSWLGWGLLGLFIGYLLDRLRAMIRK
ncbi:MAG: hypothetical protein K6T91_06285 [Firmicutes bacterium]|nr:hypothetical protein [Bacillota bacterium]